MGTYVPRNQLQMGDLVFFAPGGNINHVGIYISDGNFEISTIEQFQDILDTQPDLKGLNVTIPYKQSVIPYLKEISDGAKRIGAVNTIVNKDGDLYGYNTD